MQFQGKHLVIFVFTLLLGECISNPLPYTEEERRIIRRKRPCRKSNGRTLFGVTFLIGDVVVNQAAPCQNPGIFSDPANPGWFNRPGWFGNQGIFNGGLFNGIGGLFGSGVRPTVENNIENDKPIFEEVEEDEVQEDYKPSVVVGAPSQDVGGFTQDLTNLRPDKFVKRIGNQLNRYIVNPFVGLIYKR